MTETEEEAPPARVPDGLYGVAVAETRISKSAGDGSLIYRGYEIRDLFEKASLEECMFLVLEGRLPNRKELEVFVGDLASRSEPGEALYDLVRTISAEAHPMDVLRTAVSGLGANERGLTPKDQQLSLIAKMPALVANCYRLVHGLEALRPRSDLGWAGNLLYMLTGNVPSRFDTWAFERELIVYLEHDLNASTFTVRVVASTLADVYSAVTAGLASLKGPLHGGANEAAMEMLLEIGTPERSAAYIQERLSKGSKIMGFGHRVYKKVDPRAQLSKELLKRLLDEKGIDDSLYRLAKETEEAMWSAKKIPPNLDFYAAPVFYTLSIPIPVYTPIFAASRVTGWVTHYNEQIAHNRLFRPDSIYVGPTGLSYIPLEERG